MGGATSHTRKDYQTLQDIAETRDDIAQFWYSEFQSRTRVYPQDITAPITLTPNAVANTFGNWAQIIAAGEVVFNYHVHSLNTMGATGADSFFIQLALNNNPNGAQYLGEKAFALAAAGRARVNFACPTIPANTPVYGRVKTATGNFTIDVTLAIVRCICTPDLRTLLAARRNVWP